MTKQIRVWITKYALTRGIYQRHVEVCDPETSPDGMIVSATTGYPAYFRKQDWRHTREEAAARAHEMRVKKIAALKRQIKKLESMTF